jgi:hypothetical protein
VDSAVVNSDNVGPLDAGARAAISCAAVSAAIRGISRAAFEASVTDVTRDAQGEGTYHVRYETALGRGSIDVAGSPPAVLASSDFRPLAMRRNRAIGTAVILAIGASVVFTAHRGRDTWYAQHGHGWIVLALGLATALVGALAVAGLLLAPPARNAARTWTPLCAAVVAAIATFVAHSQDGPALATARSALAAGDVEAARFEASALLRLGRDKDGARAILDDVHVHDVRAASDPAHLAALVRAPWWSAAKRQGAVARFVQVASDAVSKAYMDGSFTGLAAIALLVGDLDPTLTERASGLAVLAHATHCARTRDFACATSQLKTVTPAAVTSEAVIVKANVVSAMGSYIANQARESDARRDPYSRRDVLSSAVAAAKVYEEFVGSPSTPSLEVLKSKLEGAQREAVAADGRSAPQPAIE